MSEFSIWGIVKGAFDTSPFLAAIVLLILWLGFCWKFRLITVGKKNPLPDRLLASLSVQKMDGEHMTLDQFHILEVFPNQSAVGIKSSSSNKEIKEDDVWRFNEIYKVYMTMIARGMIVRYTTLVVLFVLIAFGVMYMAQPSKDVSLLSVANVIGAGALLPLSILSMLSFSMMLLSAHHIPVDIISGKSAKDIILFSC